MSQFIKIALSSAVAAASLWGGVVADRFDRRRVMFATQTCMAFVAVSLAAMTFAGRESVVLIYLLNALSAAAISFDTR